jgi:hypothetical protein
MATGRNHLQGSLAEATMFLCKEERCRLEVNLHGASPVEVHAIDITNFGGLEAAIASYTPAEQPDRTWTDPSITARTAALSRL